MRFEDNIYLIKMVEPLEPTFIFYFLILPMVIGIGIDSRVKNKYAFGALCGVIFYFFLAFWTYYRISPAYAEMEPIIILITCGLSLLLIGFIFEFRIPSSNVQRHAVVFLAVALNGLPLLMIKAVIEGRMGFEYPSSMLPLFQFTLAVVGLVVLANVFETRLYLKNEGKAKKMIRKAEDLLDMKFEDMDEMDIEEGIHYPREQRMPYKRPDVSYMDMNYDPDEFHKK
jgi:hypothetical protein